MKKLKTTFLLMSVLLLSVGSVMAKETDFKYHGDGIYSTVHEVRADIDKFDDKVKPVKPEKPERQPNPNKPIKPDKDETSFYELMGVSWFSTPNYAVADDLFDVVTMSISTWDSSTGFDLLGERSNDIGSGFDAVIDGKNSFTSGDYHLDGVIAVCRTWRNIYTGEIVEYDIMFDTDFVWGDASIDSGVMDYQNIATHELGHAFGLLDLYDSEMSEQTMYGYSSYNDIKKRTLAYGDIAGIQAIYGM